MANIQSLITGIKKLSLSKKILITVILVLIVILSVINYTHHNLIWQGMNIEISEDKQNSPGRITPLETSNYQYIDKEKAFSVADFPIRIIDGMKDWEKIGSNGVYADKYSVDAYGKSVHSTGPLSYWEIYNNGDNKELIVTQEKAAHMKGFGKISFPKGSKVLNGFNKDLAILIDFHGRKELNLYLKEKNGNITLITIYANVDDKTVKNFAQKYIKVKE